MSERNRVVIETGSKKVFATAIDWPGWSRSAEADALETLPTMPSGIGAWSIAGAGALPETFG